MSMRSLEGFVPSPVSRTNALFERAHNAVAQFAEGHPAEVTTSQSTNLSLDRNYPGRIQRVIFARERTRDSALWKRRGILIFDEPAYVQGDVTFRGYMSESDGTVKKYEGSSDRFALPDAIGNPSVNSSITVPNDATLRDELGLIYAHLLPRSNEAIDFAEVEDPFNALVDSPAKFDETTHRLRVPQGDDLYVVRYHLPKFAESSELAIDRLSNSRTDRGLELVDTETWFYRPYPELNDYMKYELLLNKDKHNLNREAYRNHIARNRLLNDHNESLQDALGIQLERGVALLEELAAA